MRTVVALRLTVKGPSRFRRLAAYFVAAVLGPDRAAEYLVDGMRFDVADRELEVREVSLVDKPQRPF